MLHHQGFGGQLPCDISESACQYFPLIFGNYKVLDDGICEMKIDFGPGYRVYYAQEGLRVYLLLIGGDKASQKQDIAMAKDIWRTIKEKQQ